MCILQDTVAYITDYLNLARLCIQVVPILVKFTKMQSYISIWTKVVELSKSIMVSMSCMYKATYIIDPILAPVCLSVAGHLLLLVIAITTAL